MEQDIVEATKGMGGALMWAGGLAFAAVSGGVKYVHGLASGADKKASKALIIANNNKETVDRMVGRIDKIYDHLVKNK